MSQGTNQSIQELVEKYLGQAGITGVGLGRPKKHRKGQVIFYEFTIDWFGTLWYESDSNNTGMSTKGVVFHHYVAHSEWFITAQPFILYQSRSGEENLDSIRLGENVFALRILKKGATRIGVQEFIESVVNSVMMLDIDPRFRKKGTV